MHEDIRVRNLILHCTETLYATEQLDILVTIFFSITSHYLEFVIKKTKIHYVGNFISHTSMPAMVLFMM